MPKCKNCGTRLTKFDNDICPVCGTKNPLEGVRNETVEITTEINLNKEQADMYHPKKKKTFFLLFSLIGWSGAPFFYIKRYVEGWFLLFISLILIGGIGTIIFTLSDLKFYGYLIVILVDYIFNICYGAILINKADYKDGNGEFLR